MNGNISHIFDWNSILYIGDNLIDLEWKCFCCWTIYKKKIGRFQNGLLLVAVYILPLEITPFTFVIFKLHRNTHIVLMALNLSKINEMFGRGKQLPSNNYCLTARQNSFTQNRNSNYEVRIFWNIQNVLEHCMW